MRFLREGAGPGGLPGGRGSATSFVAGWGARGGGGVGGRQWGGRAKAPGLSPHTPHLFIPSSPGLTGGVHLASPRGQMKTITLTARQAKRSFQGSSAGEGSPCGAHSPMKSVFPFCK